jgi:hypothetical protein
MLVAPTWSVNETGGTEREDEKSLMFASGRQTPRAHNSVDRAATVDLDARSPDLGPGPSPPAASVLPALSILTPHGYNPIGITSGLSRG